jgi:hypothetical protein
MSQFQNNDDSLDILTLALGQDAELQEVSCLVREVQRQDDIRGAAAARDTFAPLHSRLMERIAQDTAATFVAVAPALESPAIALRRWPWNTDKLFARKRQERSRRMAYGMVFASLLVGASWSAHEIGRVRSLHELPMQAFINDYKKNSGATPFDLPDSKSTAATADASSETDKVARDAAKWIDETLPPTSEAPSNPLAGLTLLNVRQATLGSRPVTETHYLHNGLRVALYQVRDVRAGLGSFDEVILGRRTYLTASRGRYRVIAWRVDEDIFTMVSPFSMPESLILAQRLRNATTSEAAAESAGTAAANTSDKPTGHANEGAGDGAPTP